MKYIVYGQGETHSDINKQKQNKTNNLGFAEMISSPVM